MHIGIDAHSIGTGLGGNETYAANLVEALAEVDSTNSYTVYVTKQAAVNRYAHRWSNVRVRMIFPHMPLVRIPLALSVELRRHPLDILHVQYTAPPFSPCPVVATIHDLSFEHLPETFTRRSRMQMRLTIRRTAREAAHIITDSSFSRDDILRTYRLPPERVTVTPLAASSRYKPVRHTGELRRVREKYGIAGDYVLAVGSIQPRKNISRLIEAYDIIYREHILEPLPKLVIVGKQGWLYEGTLRAANRIPARDNIVFTGYVPDEDLPSLYSDARCLVYPSYFEGFGIPLLEAMACGTPTITANCTSLPEVAGDAGLLVDPFNERSIAMAIVRLHKDAELRKQLQLKGFERAKLFNWHQTARLTLSVYENLDARTRCSSVKGRSLLRKALDRF